MMSTNPYAFDDNEDVDLFEPVNEAHDSEKHQLIQEAIDKLIQEVGEPMSAEDRQRFTEILGRFPVDVLRNVEMLVQSVNGNFSLMDRFADFTQSIETLNPNAPLLRAMYEVLNEMTGGAIARRWKVYRHEQLLFATHFALKGINNMAEHAQADDAPQVILNLFSNMVQSLLDRIFHLCEEYRQYAQAEGLVADESLIENGTYTPERFDETMEFTVNTVFEVAMNALGNREAG